MKKKFETARNPIAAAPVDPPVKQPEDAELCAAVETSLQQDGRVADEDVKVAVSNGCAVLTGSVSREFLRVLAEACASAVPGVLVVMNRLEVRQKGPMERATD